MSDFAWAAFHGFITLVLLYRAEDLPALGAYLGTPIDLERPTSAPA